MYVFVCVDCLTCTAPSFPLLVVAMSDDSGRDGESARPAVLRGSRRVRPRDQCPFLPAYFAYSGGHYSSIVDRSRFFFLILLGMTCICLCVCECV